MKVLALFLAFGVVSFAFGDITLDDFTSGADSQFIRSGSSYFDENGTMVGGTRTPDLVVTSNPFTAPLELDVVNGYASFSAGPALESISGLGYGYHASADHSSFSTFDLALDLSSQSEFVLTFASNEHAMSGFFGLNADSSTLTSFSVAASFSPQTIIIPFSAIGGSVDFSDIHQIAFFVGSPASNDYTLSSFSAAPEPASAALMALGAIGLIARRRRR